MRASVWAEFLLFHVLRTILFYPTPQHAYRVAVLAAMVYIIARLYQPSAVTGSVLHITIVGGMINLHSTYTVYVLFLGGPFPDYWRRVCDEGLPSEFPLMKKLWWMVDIAFNFRMVGWVQEPRDKFPPHPLPSRLTFVRKTFLKLIADLVVIDFTSSVLAHSPTFDSRVHDPTDGPETYLTALPLLYRAPYILACVVRLGALPGVPHKIVGLVCVALGWSSPTLWPDIWGYWGDAYTVRRLWGRTWHQTLRVMLAGHGKFIANKLLGFPRGTNRSAYTQLYVAFFVSAYIHFAGDYLFERRVVYHWFNFFLLQAVGITIEDFVIFLAKLALHQRGVGLKQGKVDESWVWVARIIGYCWVTVWSCITFPIWFDALNAAGWTQLERGPITQFILGIWKRWA